MGSQLPREPSGHSLLHEWCRKALRCIRERTPLPGPDYSIDESPAGYRLKFKQKAMGGGGGGGLAWKGPWQSDKFYKAGDLATRRLDAFATDDPRTLGTFYCVRDHLSAVANMPKERTQDQLTLDSADEEDIWRTFAAGAFPKLVIRAFPIQVAGGPDIDDPLRFLELKPDTVLCTAANGFVSLGATNGVIKGETVGGGKFEIDCTQLPAGSLMKPRLETLCIGSTKYTAYFLKTENVAVP